MGSDGETALVECEARFSENDEVIITQRRPLIESEETFASLLQTTSVACMPSLAGTAFCGPVESWAASQGNARPNATACFPLFSGHRQTKILCFDGYRDTVPFDGSIIAYLNILWTQAAATLENLQLRKHIAVRNRERGDGGGALGDDEEDSALIQRMRQTASWRWDAATDMIEASPELFRIYEIAPRRRVPSKKLVDLTHADDLPAIRTVLRKTIAGRRLLKLEFRITVGLGEIKYVQIEGNPQIDDDGRLHYVGVTVDVTERRNAENALQAARAELARAHRLSTMGEMAASIVHEVYQPLTGILTNAEACLRWLSKSPAETARASDSARRIARDARRAAEVFRGLRAVASSAGITKVPVDLDDAVREVTFLLQGELDLANIRLRLQAATPKPVLGDRTQIQQVLENLIRNSMDALLPVVDKQRFLLVSTGSHDEACAMITVQDNGCGFGEHSPEELFDALFTTKPNGMGMGLKVCRSIIEAHGGEIQAEQRPEGTVFRFSLPYINGASDT
jgi:PAS domain S-box-containing protein